MDHIWNSLKEWESIWEEQLEAEKDGEDHEHKIDNVDLLTKQLQSIRKSIKEIGKWV